MGGRREVERQNLARMVTEYVMSKRASARIMFLTRMCPVNCVSIVMCGQIVVDWKLSAHGDERANAIQCVAGRVMGNWTQCA